ncbi:MAG: hypothetical protein ACJA01_004180 [Saprospiraceae bacterium]|jgi:hypothetical protein
MKRNIIGFWKFVILSYCLTFFGACNNSEPNPSFSHGVEKDSHTGEKPIDRNMFGIGIPRGLTLSEENLTEGYVMFAPTNSPNLYLINRKGEVVHQWKSTYRADNAYFMEDGSLIVGANDPDYSVFGCCGPYGRLQKMNWEGKILWDYEYATEEHILHHDFSVMPNGNILAIAYEIRTYDEAIAKGRKSEMIPKSGLWPEKIVEIAPEGKHGAEIIWAWHLWDHMVQDVDKSKSNFGNPADHPELLDINVGHPIPPAISQDSVDILIAKKQTHRNTTPDNMGSDVYHANAIMYNPEIDQIVFSSPALSEVFIIDHSTTTKEAASHKGGKYGKGGDFIYRWGNPQNYQRGDSLSRKLFGQHDVRWIESGKPGEGNLTVFNNHPPQEIDWSTMGTTASNYSEVLELSLPSDSNGNYIIEKDQSYGPAQPSWKFMAPDTQSFFSAFISGAHRMENGNTFINQGARGRFFEVTPEGDKVWEYLNPFRGDVRENNGDPINPMPMVFIQFRSTFIPADHAALSGKELIPLDPQPETYKLPPPPSM